MSNISIEGKNLKDIDQSNFQSVGPYTDRDEVIEPWQGRNKESGSQDTDLRFKLGTYTENNRDYWEIQTVDSRTRRSQFQSEDLKTATAERKDDLVISDEVNWSVDTFPFVTNEDNETIPLYFYYDKELHPTEYNNAIHRKVNLRIELRESGRGTDGIIDNFLDRQPFRPFIFGLNKNSYGTTADGIVLGGGAFKFEDSVRIEAIPNPDTYLERWTDGDNNQTLSTNAIYSFSMPKNDFEIVGNFRLNPTIRMTSRVNGVVDEGAGTIWFGDVADNPVSEEPLTNTMADARRIHNFYSDEPIDDVIPDWGNVDYMTGTLRGHNNVFKLADSTLDTQSSDEYYSEYIYTWEANITNLDGYPELSETFNMPDTALERNTHKPNDEIKLFSIPSGPEFGFVNFTYINSDNEEVELEVADQTPSVRPLDYYTGPVTVHQVKFPYQYTGEEINYPSAIMQIYVNYVVALYAIRNYNKWRDGQPSFSDDFDYRIRFGYGDVSINDQIVDTFQNERLNTPLNIKALPAVGYKKSDRFFLWPGGANPIEMIEDLYKYPYSGPASNIFADQLNADYDVTIFPILDEPIENDYQTNFGNVLQGQSGRLISIEDNSHYIGHEFDHDGIFIQLTTDEESEVGVQRSVTLNAIGNENDSQPPLLDYIDTPINSMLWFTEASDVDIPDTMFSRDDITTNHGYKADITVMNEISDNSNTMVKRPWLYEVNVWYRPNVYNEISNQGLTNTLSNARLIDGYYGDGEGDPDSGFIDYMTGTLSGYDNVFRLVDSTADSQSDPDYQEYLYTWEANIQDLNGYPAISDQYFEETLIPYQKTTLWRNPLQGDERWGLNVDGNTDLYIRNPDVGNAVDIDNNDLPEVRLFQSGEPNDLGIPIRSRLIYKPTKFEGVFYHNPDVIKIIQFVFRNELNQLPFHGIFSIGLGEVRGQIDSYDEIYLGGAHLKIRGDSLFEPSNTVTTYQLTRGFMGPYGDRDNDGALLGEEIETPLVGLNAVKINDFQPSFMELNNGIYSSNAITIPLTFVFDDINNWQSNNRSHYSGMFSNPDPFTIQFGSNWAQQNSDGGGGTYPNAKRLIGQNLFGEGIGNYDWNPNTFHESQEQRMAVDKIYNIFQSMNIYLDSDQDPSTFEYGNSYDMDLKIELSNDLNNVDLQKFYEYLELSVDTVRNPIEYQGEVVNNRQLVKFPIEIKPNLFRTTIQQNEDSGGP